MSRRKRGARRRPKRRHELQRTPGRVAWTEEILDAVRRCSTQVEAAKVLGICPTVVNWHVRRYGLPEDQHGSTLRDRVRVFIKTADLDRRVVFLSRCGMEPREIAEHLEVSRTKVNQLLREARRA